MSISSYSIYERISVLFVIVFFSFLALFFLNPDRSHALTISPARIELSVNPGQTVTSQFELINEQQNTQTFYFSAQNFEAQGETGTPNFVDSKDGLASWISLPSSIILKKGEDKIVSFKITVPKNADPGGYFAAAFLNTAPPQTSNSQVSVGAKIGVLVLLRVSGNVKEGGGIVSFSTVNNQRFFTSLPVAFNYRFANSGRDRIQPAGTFSVNDTIGLNTVTLPANPSQGNILPNSIRRFDLAWGQAGDSINNPGSQSGFWAMAGQEWSNFAFGFYNAHITLTYGTANTQASASYFIFVFPWQLLLIILILLIAVFFIFRFIMKRYNRYIISQAQRMNGQDKKDN